MYNSGHTKCVYGYVSLLNGISGSIMYVFPINGIPLVATPTIFPVPFTSP
jgi:hypothetical protein